MTGRNTNSTKHDQRAVEREHEHAEVLAARRGRFAPTVTAIAAPMPIGANAITIAGELEHHLGQALAARRAW